MTYISTYFMRSHCLAMKWRCLTIHTHTHSRQKKKQDSVIAIAQFISCRILFYFWRCSFEYLIKEWWSNKTRHSALVCAHDICFSAYLCVCVQGEAYVTFRCFCCCLRGQSPTHTNRCVCVCVFCIFSISTFCNVHVVTEAMNNE